MTFARHTDSPLLLWSESENRWTTDIDVATEYEAAQKPQLPADAVWIGEYEIREQTFAALIVACREAGVFRSMDSTALLAEKLRVEPRNIMGVAADAEFVLDEAQSLTLLDQEDGSDRNAEEQKVELAALSGQVAELSSEDYATAVIGALVEHHAEKSYFRNKDGEHSATPRLGIIAGCEFQETDDPDIVAPVLEVLWEGDGFTIATPPIAVIFRRTHLGHLNLRQLVHGRSSWSTKSDPASTPHRLTLLDPSARKKQAIELDGKLYAEALRHALVEHEDTGKLGLVMAISVDLTGAQTWRLILRVQWEDEPAPQETAAKHVRFHRALFQHLKIDQKLSTP